MNGCNFELLSKGFNDYVISILGINLTSHKYAYHERKMAQFLVWFWRLMKQKNGLLKELLNYQHSYTPQDGITNFTVSFSQWTISEGMCRRVMNHAEFFYNINKYQEQVPLNILNISQSRASCVEWDREGKAEKGNVP
jgi:hypothetical protein